jgi:hypothetical protein
MTRATYRAMGAMVGVPDKERMRYSIDEFCELHGISKRFYFKLKAQGLTPVEMKVRQRTLISQEAAARWRAEREKREAAHRGLFRRRRYRRIDPVAALLDVGQLAEARGSIADALIEQKIFRFTPVSNQTKRPTESSQFDLHCQAGERGVPQAM